MHSALCNIMRYSPHEWNNILSNKVSSEFSLLISKYLRLFELKYPMLVVQQLTNFAPVIKPWYKSKEWKAFCPPLLWILPIPLSRTGSPYTGFPPAGREVPAWSLPWRIPWSRRSSQPRLSAYRWWCACRCPAWSPRCSGPACWTVSSRPRRWRSPWWRMYALTV